MIAISYHSALNHAAELAPTLGAPYQFIKWAEPISQLISSIYSVDYDTVTLDLTEKCKEEQGYEDEDDEDEE